MSGISSNLFPSKASLSRGNRKTYGGLISGGPWVAWVLEHRTPDWKAWVRCPMPPNTLRVRTESHAKIVDEEIGGVAIYRPFGEFRRVNSYCHLYGVKGLGQRQRRLKGISEIATNLSMVRNGGAGRGYPFRRKVNRSRRKNAFDGNKSRVIEFIDRFCIYHFTATGLAS
ncbi:hypothetical protein TNCV_640781 [Trichonephila clavipes]|nr:hypothetical protein TNCV_640781 [Trichonephila clavipes]